MNLLKPRDILLQNVLYCDLFHFMSLVSEL